MIFGSACYWAWVLLDRSGLVPYGSASPTLNQQLLTGTMALTGFLIFFVSIKIPWRKIRLTLSIIIVILIIWSECISQLYASNEMALNMSSVMLCCARAGFMQLWSVWILTLPRRVVVQGLLMSISFAAILLLSMIALPLEISRALFPLLPIISAVLAGFQSDNYKNHNTQTFYDGRNVSFRRFLAIQVLIGFSIGLLSVLGNEAPLTIGAWKRFASLVCSAILVALILICWRKKASRSTILAMPIILAVAFMLSLGDDLAFFPSIAFILCWLYSSFVSNFHILRFSIYSSMPFVRLILLATSMCALGTFLGSFLGIIRDAFPIISASLSSASFGISIICVLSMLTALIYLLQVTMSDINQMTSTHASDADLYNKIVEKYHLTAREKDVLELLGKGYSRPHISKELYLSESTVKTHSANLYRKLGISKRDQLLKMIAELKNL